MVFGLFGPRGRSDLGAFRPPSSPSRYITSDAFSQPKVLSVPGKRELTVPAREAPPTVETDLMELGMYFVGHEGRRPTNDSQKENVKSQHGMIYFELKLSLLFKLNSKDTLEDGG